MRVERKIKGSKGEEEGQKRIKGHKKVKKTERPVLRSLHKP